MTDQLNKATLEAALSEVGVETEVRFFEACDSTNTEAKRMVADGYKGSCLIVAEEQSGGRGRMGRSFYSPRASGVYFTLLHRITADAADAVTLTCAAAVAAMRGILRSTGVQTSIKWVNDLLLDGRKVCGILSESVTSPGGDRYVIIGIGINLRPVDFPSELCEIAGSIGNNEVARADLIAAVICELMPSLVDPRSRAWHADYVSASCVIGRRIRWGREQDWKFGEATGIDRDGRLLVRADGGEIAALDSGEITLRTV